MLKTIATRRFAVQRCGVSAASFAIAVHLLSQSNHAFSVLLSLDVSRIIARKRIPPYNIRSSGLKATIPSVPGSVSIARGVSVWPVRASRGLRAVAAAAGTVQSVWPAGLAARSGIGPGGR
jgi:hypothetical protein